MKCPRRRRPAIRLLLVAALVLCLGVRLLTPAGFMPSFASGWLAIVPCPDASGSPPMAAMPDIAGMDMQALAMPEHGQHGDNHGFHQTCPYASAASLVGIDPGVAALVVLVLLAVLAPTAAALRAFRRQATRDRPPSQGPPIPA